MSADKLTQLARILIEQNPILFGIELRFMLKIEDPKEGRHADRIIDPDPKWSVEVRDEYHHNVVPKSVGKTAEEAILNTIRAVANRRKERLAKKQKELDSEKSDLESAVDHVAQAESVMGGGK